MNTVGDIEESKSNWRLVVRFRSKNNRSLDGFEPGQSQRDSKAPKQRSAGKGPCVRGRHHLPILGGTEGEGESRSKDHRSAGLLS